VATTILAVDDSVTMRKILEITFAGTEFNVVTVPTGDAALQKLRGEPFGLVISDITLEPANGYELCKQMKAASPATPVLLLSSRQNPYDAGAGSAAGADDHIDKPFDTQQMIDRVTKMLREGAGAPAPQQAAAASAPPAAAAAAGGARARTLIYGGPGAPGASTPAPAAVAATPDRVGNTTMQSAAAPKPASSGMGFGARPAAAAQPAARPMAATPSAAPPAAAAARPAAAAPAAAPQAVSAAVGSAVNGQLASKVAELGLTPAQVDAVLSLSRELVERVVWEVVPVLAETIIKEELARLTK
jgi:CheY-like chemotaxis protein